MNESRTHTQKKKKKSDCHRKLLQKKFVRQVFSGRDIRAYRRVMNRYVKI